MGVDIDEAGHGGVAAFVAERSPAVIAASLI
jgi:hypothetical protein